MVGIQTFYRRLLLFNTSRLFKTNAVLLQSSRGRHHLVFKIFSPENRVALKQSKLLFNANIGRNFTLRLSSTNIPPTEETISETVKPEIVNAQNNSSKLSNDAELAESSNLNVVIDESTLPPVPKGEVTEVPVLEFVSTGLKEPTFESLGLGSWWPTGLVQQLFEFIHVNLDLQWWQAIIVVTWLTRILLFPVNLQARKNSINMTNHFPQISEYQRKITEARITGDFYTVASLTADLQNYVREKNVDLLGIVKTTSIQAPIFISMYTGLKGMANCPVESMKTQGLFWFQDLTVPDPYYILPGVLCITMWIIIEVGAEGSPAGLNSHTVKWVMRCIPAVIFAVSTQFSACLTYYWTISNLIILLQVALLKIPAVSKYFGIPTLIKHNLKREPSKGFLEGFKEGFENAKISSELQDRQRVNLLEFQKAGSGAVPRTFKRNPLLQKEGK